MKNSIYILVFFLFSSFYNGQSQNEVVFLNDNFTDLLSQAGEMNKVMVIEFPDSGSVNYRIMKNEIFTHPKVVTILNDNFINYEYSQATSKKQNLVSKYKIVQRPAYIFIDKDKNLLYKLQGEVTVNDFLVACNYAINPQENFYAWNQRLTKQGDKNIEYLFNYAKGLYKAGDDYTNVAEKYFEYAQPDFVREFRYIDATLLFHGDLADDKFILFLDSWSHIDKTKFNQSDINQRIAEIISDGLIRAKIQNPAINVEDSANKLIVKYNLDDPRSMIALINLKLYSEVEKNRALYYQWVSEYVQSSITQYVRPEIINYISEISKFCDETEICRMSMNTMMDIIARENKIQYHEIIMRLAMKTGEYNEAYNELQTIRSMNGQQKIYSQDDLNRLENELQEGTQR